jgi:excisionase family DNA binding protein
MIGDDEVMTAKEVCELLHIHPKTLYIMIRKENLPAFRIGSDWRFRKDLILRWMAERTAG